jgi:hypothetical protein
MNTCELNINDRKLNILQINLQKKVSATTQLVQYIYEKNIDIVLAQEPYLINNRVALLPANFHIFQSTNKPKTAIITNPSNINAMPIVKHISDYTIWCNLKYCDKILYQCSAYLPPDTSLNIPPESILNSSNNALTDLKPTYHLIGADCNAKSKLWKSKASNRRGNLIIEFFSQNRLFFLNNSNKPTYMSSLGESIIDLPFSNENLLRYFTDWRVEDDETNSDQCYITLKIDIKT